MKNQLQVEATLVDVIKDILVLPNTEVTLNTRLADDLDMDSLDFAEFLMALEDTFEIEVSQEALEGFEKVEGVVRFICEKKGIPYFACRSVSNISQAGEPKRVAEMSDLELNWALASCLGKDIVWSEGHGCYGEIDKDDSIALEPLADYVHNWAVTGPLLEEFWIGFEPVQEGSRVQGWLAKAYAAPANAAAFAKDSTQLRAAVKAILYALSVDSAKIPEWLKDVENDEA